MPTIFVCGGTGLQGSGFIFNILQNSNKEWKLKTMTRNCNNKTALLLKQKGVQVLQGSLLDENFVVSALENVDILFASTFSDHDGTEVKQGINLANAAVKNNIPIVIYSGGESIGIDEMDNKAKIESYFRSLSLRKVIYIHSAFFFENIATKRGTKRVKVDNFKNPTHYVFSIPLKEHQRIPFISPYDIGVFSANLITQSELMSSYQNGDVIPIAGDVLSPSEFINLFQKATNKQAIYKEFSLDFFRQLPIPGAHLIVLMYQWYHAGCPGNGHDRDPVATRKICPQVRNCEEWLNTSGIELINVAAYEDNLTFKLSQIDRTSKTSADKDSNA